MTQVTTFDYRVPAEWFGGSVDTEAVDDAVLAELNALLPEGVSIVSNGMVFADVEVADAAREIDFQELLDSIDVAAIALEYDISTR